MSGNVAATLALGVSTGRAASDLLELTGALKAFKSALTEFNQQKVQNPLANLKGSTAEAVASLKTQLAEAETANKKLTEQMQAHGSKRVQGMNQHYLMLRQAQVKQAADEQKLNEAGFRNLLYRQVQAQAKGQALNEEGHRQVLYRQVQADSKIAALKESGYRHLEGQKLRHAARMAALDEGGVRAQQLAGFKAAALIGPDRNTPAQLRGAQIADDFKAQAAAAKQAAAATNTHAAATKSASAWTYTHARAMNDAHSAARGLASGFGAMWLTWGNIVPLLAGAAISNGIVQATKAGAEFAYQLTFVKALGDETAMTMGLVGERTREISKSGLQGPVELANGLRMLAQAGLTAQESIQALPHVMHLATVGETTMAEAGVTLAGVMNAFRLKIGNFEHIGDVFAKAAAVSQTSVQQMTQAMRMASVVGEQYGATMEDTATALTVLARVNITGTAAGTSLRNMLKELYTPMDGVRKVMQQIGLQASDANGNLRPFADIIYDLRGKLEGFDKASQSNILQKLFGERGAKEAIAMLSLTRVEWDKLRDSISDSQGFAAKVSKQLEDTAKGQFKQALNTLQATMIEAFEGAEGPMKEFAQALKDLAGSPGLMEAMKGLLTVVADLAKILVQTLPTLIEIVKVAGTFLLITKGLTVAASGWAALTAGATAGSLALMSFTAVARGTATTLTGSAGLMAALRMAGGGLLGMLTPMGWVIAAAAAAGTAFLLFRDKTAEAMQDSSALVRDFAKNANDDLSEVIRKMHSVSAEVSKAQLESVRAGLVQANSRVSEMQEALAKNHQVVGIDQARMLAGSAAEGSRGPAVDSAAAFVAAWDEREAIVKKYYSTVEEVEKLAKANEDASKLKTGKGKFGDTNRDLGAQISAEKTGITDLFNHAEKSAKAQYDHEVTLANALLSGKHIGEDEFLAKRFAAEEKYINEVSGAYWNAEKGLIDLKTQADKDSQRRQLENASQRIMMRIAEQVEQDKVNQKTKLGLAEIAAMADAKQGQKAVTKLNMDAEKDRFAKLANEYAKTLSSEDQAALAARVQETNRYASAIEAANVQYEDSIRKHGALHPITASYYTTLKALQGAQEENVGAAENLARALDKTHRSMAYGAQEAFAAYINGATNAAEQSKQVWSAALGGIEGEFAKFIRHGKADWRSFANVILDQLARIASARMVAGIGNAVMGVWSGGGGAGSMSGNGSVQGNSDYIWDIHSGGIAGAGEGSSLRSRPMSLFSGAPRYHGGGLAGDEVPAVLQKGEGVFTERQMKKLAPVGTSGGNSFQVSIHVDAKGTKSEGDAGAATNLAKKLEGEMKRILMNEMRPGGLLENV